VKYAFYPGCSLDSTARDFDVSTRAVCKALGIELVDIPDWNCCGSTPAHASNASLSVALPVMNLQKAKATGCDGVLTACASCYARLRTANHKVRTQPEERERAERITEQPYAGEMPVRHILDILFNELGRKAIRAKAVHGLQGLRVASYYGCLLSRPPEVVAFDNPEHPTCMDEVVGALGGAPVDWPFKTECCGASLSISNPKVVGRLGHRILDMAQRAGAQCMAVACPLCQINLDLRQSDAAKAHGPLKDMPILYITQLLGIALGLPAGELGLNALVVSPKALLEPVAAVAEGA